LGDHPPQRSTDYDWQVWIGSAGRHNFRFGQLGARSCRSSFDFTRGDLSEVRADVTDRSARSSLAFPIADAFGTFLRLKQGQNQINLREPVRLASKLQRQN
jgi:hypothetical protein